MLVFVNSTKSQQKSGTLRQVLICSEISLYGRVTYYGSVVLSGASYCHSKSVIVIGNLTTMN